MSGFHSAFMCVRVTKRRVRELIGWLDFILVLQEADALGVTGT
jgi:hypothetical protein